ncbi:hypothetical protein [Latilactobacillus sakei]|uniref:hypothetical protein n=1 Tax=Latilactobacillus sakei TaxID=1599 RepID=UPI001BD61361|nr:hypothetical protein [Latilactobacillus sakei]QVQ49758.1 hypothetical protein KIK01_04600 [Latilactobacillus sakei subsp. sakei]
MVKLTLFDNTKIVLKDDDVLCGTAADAPRTNKLAIRDFPHQDIVAFITHFIKETPLFIAKRNPNIIYSSADIIEISIRS